MPTPSDYYDPGSQPNSLLPPTYYRPPPPPKDGNDPTKTQTAAVPRVPPPTPRTDQAPTPSAVQPPAPIPSPLGDWDHANEVPDSQRPYIRPVVGRVLPNRPPDGYSQGRPIYNLRPGEQGYSAGASPGGNWEVQNNNFAGMRNPHVPAAGGPNTNPGGWQRFATPEAGIQAISQQLDRYASGQTTGTPLRTIRQIVSTWAPPSDNNPTDALIARASRIVGVGPDVPLNLSDPNVKAKLVEATVRNEQGGALPPTAAAGINSVFGRNTVAGPSTVAGPVQRYIPPQPREASDWGRTPEHDWTPGRMPTSHDIPNILGALLPIAIAGVLGGGGLGMIAAYTGYQNARNKGQLEAAKEARTRWRDQLAETEAGLKEELLESSGLMAEFGNDFTSPASKAAWSELANKYQDQQLGAALESGNYAAVEQLFKKRDEAFQSISKVSAATTKAEEQEQQKEADQKTEAAWGVPGAQQPSAGSGGAPPGPEKPWENLGQGFAGGGQPAAPPPPPGGGPGAGAQPGRAPAPPAAAPAPSQQPPASEEPPPGPEAPSPPQPPGSEPQPAAAPAPPAAPRSVFDELVSEGVNGQDIEKFKAGVPKDMLPKLQGAIAQKNAQIDAVQPGPNAAAQLAAIDPNFAGYVTGVSRYTAALPSPRANTGREFTTRVQEAAKKINPQWNFANYKKQEEFADPKGSVQIRLTRASTMGEAAANVMKDAKVLQDSGIEVTQDKISEAIDRIVNNLGGTSPYMAIANDILAFTQEDQSLRTGNPSVTETEAQNTLVSGKVLLGSLEQIRTYVQHNIDTANAAITHYQGQWKQMQGYGDMPGTDQDANAIISSMKYLDPTSGQYHAPKGFDLPPALAAAIPEHAPPPTVLPKPGTTAAPAPTPQQGGGNAPPQPAVDYLKAHPEFRQDFDKKYGPGSAARVLGQ